jgi:threonine-phosphate decarboxylase
LREAEQRFGTSVRLDFSVNTNAFWHPPALPGAVILSQAVARYPEADADSLAERVASIYRLPKEHLVPTAGAIEGLYLATRLFSGKRALLLDPCFADYNRACLAADIETTRVHSLGDDAASLLRPDALAGIDVVILGHPNNPCGRLLRDLSQCIRDSQSAGVSWILDEAFVRAHLSWPVTMPGFKST